MYQFQQICFLFMATSKEGNSSLPTIYTMFTKIKIIGFQTWKQSFTNKNFKPLLTHMTQGLCHKFAEISSFARATFDFSVVAFNMYKVPILGPLAMTIVPLQNFHLLFPKVVKHPSSSNRPTEIKFMHISGMRLTCFNKIFCPSFVLI